MTFKRAPKPGRRQTVKPTVGDQAQAPASPKRSRMAPFLRNALEGTINMKSIDLKPVILAAVLALAGAAATAGAAEEAPPVPTTISPGTGTLSWAWWMRLW